MEVTSLKSATVPEMIFSNAIPYYTRRFDDSLLLPAHQLAASWMTDDDAAAAKASMKDLEKMDSNQICAFLDRLLQSAPLLSKTIVAMRGVGGSGWHVAGAGGCWDRGYMRSKAVPGVDGPLPFNHFRPTSWASLATLRFASVGR